MNNITQKSLLNTRLVAVLFLAFSSGLPIALTNSTLQAWFTEAHVNLITIGSLSLLGIPYSLKFIWAPLMDYFNIPIIGKRRGWVLVMQAGLGVTLLIIAQMHPSTQASQMGMLALLIAFLSASQDVSIDAYRTDILAPEERGLGAAYTVFAYRISGLISGGLALVFADRLGWKLTYEVMALLLFLNMIPTLRAPKPIEFSHQKENFFQTMTDAVRDLFMREKIIWIILLIIFYKFGDALALQLMTNFLLHGLGFTLTEVGLAYKLVSVVATIGGAFVGGVILTRWNIYRALLVFGLAQTFSNLSFVVLAMAGKQFTLMAGAIFIENFCGGLSTAALFAFLMSLCNHRYTATQFALLSAIASIGRVFMGPVAGMMVMHLGWVMFYIWSFVLCFPGLLFLLYLKNEVSAYAPVTADS